MSRIHEALKKAEQERAALQGGPAQPSFMEVESPVTADDDFPPAAVPPNTGASHASSIPSFTSPYSLDALLARCPQLDWQPDQKTMLFFNSDDNVRGTEEFRTLRSRLYHAREKMTLKKTSRDQRSAQGGQVLHIG